MEERTLASEVVHDGRIIRVRVDDVEVADGRRTRREVVEHPGAVAIVAWDGARLAMVRQWRHAVGRELLELPAGTLDPGEEPMATARRELAEECGLAAARWEEGPSFFTAPGFCTELMHLYLATDLSVADGATEAAADEQIERSWLGLGEALTAIEAGEVQDAKSLAGIYWLARRLGR